MPPKKRTRSSAGAASGEGGDSVKNGTSGSQNRHVPAIHGHWISPDRRHHQHWLKKTVKHVDDNTKELLPVLKEFKDMVESDSRLYMLFNCMFEDLPSNQKYATEPDGVTPQVRDFDHLLAVLNHILQTAPAWTDAGHSVGLVGVPVNALLDWPMGTRAGFAVFQDPKVNGMLKKVLNVWGEYLVTPESASVLGTDSEGWFGETGKKALEEVANVGQTNYTFEELFECDPKAEHHGYKNWDDFFTRLIKEEVRPVASPDDDRVIANACESKTYKVAKNVEARNKFWVKGQPYSVVDMLAQDPLAEHFVGGTVYQAFLSALSYHRWHAPVSGTIKKAYTVDGSYYSEPMYEDLDENHPAEITGETLSQEYLSVMAARAIIFIEADNKDLGLVAFLGVGMTEVSTCEITVKEGEHVKKGDLLGSFHFGGSTWCGLFQQGVNLENFPEPGQEHNVPVRSELARLAA